MAQQSERSSGGSIQGLQWLEKILARLPGALMVFDREHRFLVAMGAAFAPPNPAASDVIGKTLDEYLSSHVVDVDLRIDRIFSALSGTPSTYEAWFGSKWYEVRTEPFRDPDGSIGGVVALAIDATQRKITQLALAHRDAVLRAASSEAQMLLVTRDVDDRITFATGRLIADLGLDETRIVGSRFELLPGTRDEEHSLIRAHRAALRGRRSDAIIFRIGDRVIEARVNPFSDEGKHVCGSVAVWFDVTQRVRAEHLQRHDILTGVPNRVQLRELLAQGLEVSRRHGSGAVVAALDIDNFKRINDSLGVDVGDRLLAAIAKRICVALAPADSIARSSGDEFIIVRPDTHDPHAPGDLAKALLQIFETPFQIGRHELFMRASIGMSVFPNDGEDAAELLANADAALIQAKNHRRGTVQFYHRSLQAAIAERLTLEADLRRALERRQFELHYQPIVDIAAKRIAGVEALIRWRHPARGLIPPDAFIHVCEETGLIANVGSWVIDEAARQTARWYDSVSKEFFIAVNVSARQLDDDLYGTLHRSLERHGLTPRSIELEFTESAVIRDAQLSLSELQRLQSLGVRICIDDFGTGYSSLAYLKRLPVNSLKIDRLFVRDVAVNPYDAAIARAIIALAQSIDLRVIAEGVETVEQRDLLEALGCRYMQGYLFGCPRPALEALNAVSGV